MKYFEFVALYALFGLALFYGCRRWFNFLLLLADRHDLVMRRKIAAICYIVVVAPLMLIAIGGAWFYGILLLQPTGSRLAALALLCAVLPTLTWWVRRWKYLAELGYGRRGGL